MHPSRRSFEGVKFAFSEADSNSVASTRGRRRVFSDETLQRALRYSYARRVESRRGAQDLVYRMFALAAIEQYREAFPESAQTLEWLVKPRRHSLLSELGRVAQPRSGENGELRWNKRDVDMLIQTAFEVAERKPSTKHGVAMIRSKRKRKRIDQGTTRTSVPVVFELPASTNRPMN